MKSILDLRAEAGPGTVGHSTGGGGRPAGWTVTGRLRVHETELEGYPVERPLKGVEVRVEASESGPSGPWSAWATTRTGADGGFTATCPAGGTGRFLRVQARLAGPDLGVEDATAVELAYPGSADRAWRTIWASDAELAGPDGDLGTRLVASGEPGDLGDAIFRRQALIWYVLRTTIDRLAAEDPWHRIGRPLTVLYPARGVGGASCQSGQRLYLDRDLPDWKPEGLLFFFWHAWQEFHTSGIRRLTGSPSAAFATGFAAFATTAWLHLAWGRRLPRPYSRHHLAAGLELGSLDQVERDELGVRNVLNLLHHGARQGWWSHLFGSAGAYPANRPDDDGDGVPDFRYEAGVSYRLDGRRLPSGPDHLTFWQLLRAFKPDPAHGWETALEVGDASCGVLRFLDRVVEIHSLGEPTRRMLRDCVDPLGTTEPYESLPRAAS